jgi:BirA family transcriptional regulator, biotin operon repressor / biotin---[acetyl-CoA-carboxylase] ligase
MHLHPDAQAAGVRLIAHDTLPSTNADALARARAGECGPLWITATRQTAGRGRRGNVWTSEPGNLYATLLLSDPAPAAHLPELCFVVALAVRDAVCAAAPQLISQLKLKWPNDLLLSGAKLAGILIEAESVSGSTAVAAGIGVNCAHHPDNLAYPATSLVVCGAAVMPDELLSALSRTMLTRLAQWNCGANFAAIRVEWLAHAAGLGGDIHVRLPGRELTGTFETLDRMGRLMLRLPAGNLEAITAGELFAPARVQP